MGYNRLVTYSKLRLNQSLYLIPLSLNNKFKLKWLLYDVKKINCKDTYISTTVTDVVQRSLVFIGYCKTQPMLPTFAFITQNHQSIILQNKWENFEKLPPNFSVNIFINLIFAWSHDYNHGNQNVPRLATRNCEH